MELRLANLLMLILLQGQIYSVFSTPDNENIAVIFSSEDSDEELPVLNHPIKACLPPCDDKDNVKCLGRAVNIPAEAVESVANTPFSALSTKLPDIQKEILDVHNKYSSQDVPSERNMMKLVWNSEVAEAAEDRATQCKEGNSPRDSIAVKNSICRENVFMSNFMVPWNAVIDSWHSGNADYKNGFGALCDPEVGDFTRMTLLPTSVLGCAAVSCLNSRFHYVCHYCPAGTKGSSISP